MKTVSGEKKTAALVLGVGNVLKRDDGAGVLVVELLAGSGQVPQGVRCVDGGVAGLSLLPLIESCGHLIVIDAVRSGKRPGTVSRFLWKKGLASPKGVIPPKAAIVSAHDLGVFELLTMASVPIGKGCPKTVIIGIEPGDISPGLELTPAVKKALPAAVLAIIKELKKINAGTTGKERHARIPHGAKDNRRHKKRDVKGEGGTA